MTTPLVYKISLNKYKEYFFEYSHLATKHLILSNKIQLFFERNKFLNILLPWIISLLIITFSLISVLCFKIVFKLFGSDPSWILGDVFYYGSLFFGGSILIFFFLNIFFKRFLDSEMPYRLLDMINDQDLLEDNIKTPSRKPSKYKAEMVRYVSIENSKYKQVQPFARNRFTILAIFKNEGDSDGLYNFIPGLSTSSGFSDAKQKLRDVVINGVPILGVNNKYVDWKFEIIEYKNVIDEKEKNRIELLLKWLWDSLLSIEYERFKYRQKEYKKKKPIGLS